MSREQNARKKPIESSRRDRGKGHQTRRARGGQKQKTLKTQGGPLAFISQAAITYHRKGASIGS